MYREQLELTLQAAPHGLATIPCPRARKASRAQWWFRQMHAVVERAFDWSKAPTAPPQQIQFRIMQAH